MARARNVKDLQTLNSAVTLSLTWLWIWLLEIITIHSIYICRGLNGFKFFLRTRLPRSVYISIHSVTLVSSWVLPLLTCFKLDQKLRTPSHTQREIQAEVKKTQTRITIFQGVSIISGLGSLMLFYCNCYDVRMSVHPNGLLKTITRTEWFHSPDCPDTERHQSPAAQTSARSSAEKVRFSS